ncbi:hypothetical protein [Dyadobacter sp. LHD-138]|uniref:hypothetical protein n=1 Tax=Dyadobacter sp. LHD-138 TaxID=3071413 RepID=UPI0027DEC5D2|nr:hypothetical protein [Dyadobacter sp. LHD-138]MDQ6480883.1 hypothetical protein [Dyadobacter sp. LHD-138]
MDREETDKEARATKNTKKVWKWVIGGGIILMIIAFWGSFFSQDKNFSESDRPSADAIMQADSAASDTLTEVHPDTMMKGVGGTK